MGERSSRHRMRLVRDRLDVAQLAQGAIHVEATEFRLTALLSEVAEMMEITVREKDLQLDVLQPDAGIVMRTDRVKLEQILLNLLSNAVKFTEQGSVTLMAERRSDGNVSIIITDTGSGMPAHALAAVTEAFEQIYGRDGMKPAGIGLGLSISKRLTQALGGTLHATSAEGVGSSFTLSLPRVLRAEGEEVEVGG